MKERNWRNTLRSAELRRIDSLFLLLLELVGTKDADTVLGLGLGETALGGLEELEDFFHDNVLDIDLVLVVEVGGGELNL